MELTTVEDTNFFSHEKQCHTLPITLASKLLATMMAGEKEEVAIESRSHNFLYDPGTGIIAGNMLEAWIKEEKITQKDSAIEITLSGIIANNDCDRETLTLYVYMWWDHTLVSPIKNTCMKSLHSLPLLIRPQHATERLSDSVFELDLYRKSPSQKREYIAQGRGYLVFGRKN